MVAAAGMPRRVSRVAVSMCRGHGAARNQTPICAPCSEDHSRYIIAAVARQWCTVAVRRGSSEPGFLFLKASGVVGRIARLHGAMSAGAARCG